MLNKPIKLPEAPPLSSLYTDRSEKIAQEGLFRPQMFEPVTTGLAVADAVNRAKDTFLNKQGEINGFFSKLKYLLNIGKDATNTSLFNYVKKAQISSRVFIERDLAKEPVMKDILSVIYNIYTGAVLTATNLSENLSASTKVEDRMSIVGTEDLKNPTFYHTNISTLLDDLTPSKIGQEAMGGMHPKVKDDLKKIVHDEIHKELEDSQEKLDKKIKDAEDKAALKIANKSEVSKMPEEVSLPSGRVLKLLFNGQGSTRIEVLMTLTLFPTFVPTDIIKQFVGLQFPQSIMDRWYKMTAGEISFFKDFLLELDIQHEMRDTLKKDRTNLFFDMYMEKTKSIKNKFKKWIGWGAARQNIANTILVMDKNSLTSISKKTGRNFTNSRDRDMFFKESMAMMLVAVDMDSAIVEIYCNSLDKYGTYTLQQMERGAKNNGLDIKDTMLALAAGTAPKW